MRDAPGVLSSSEKFNVHNSGCVPIKFDMKERNGNSNQRKTAIKKHKWEITECKK